MTRRDVFNRVFESALPSYGERESESIARMVIERAFGWGRVEYALEADKLVALKPEAEQELNRITNEIEQGRPIQYILGVAEFCGFDFGVGEGVLIPRPETEELVEWIAKECEGKSQPANILDIGTGSGCIAISLAKLMGEKAFVEALDISQQALEIAKNNAHKLDADIFFHKENILSPSAGWVERAQERYDIVVSNPPYVPDSDREHIAPHVIDYEPNSALFVPDRDKILFYKAIAQLGKTILKPGGQLFFEIYEHCAQDVVRMLEINGYQNIEIRRDISEKPRMVRATKL